MAVQPASVSTRVLLLISLLLNAAPVEKCWKRNPQPCLHWQQWKLAGVWGSSLEGHKGTKKVPETFTFRRLGNYGLAGEVAAFSVPSHSLLSLLPFPSWMVLLFLPFSERVSDRTLWSDSLPVIGGRIEL